MGAAGGVFLTILGLGVALVTFVCNGETPLQLGPVPFFGGLITCVIGLACFIHFPWHAWPLVIATLLAVVAIVLLCLWLL